VGRWQDRRRGASGLRGEAEAEAGGVAGRPDHSGGVVGHAAGMQKHQLALRQVLAATMGIEQRRERQRTSGRA